MSTWDAIYGKVLSYDETFPDGQQGPKDNSDNWNRDNIRHHRGSADIQRRSMAYWSSIYLRKSIEGAKQELQRAKDSAAPAWKIDWLPGYIAEMETYL